MIHCRLLHLSLLVFNILAVWGLSVISGGKNSIFSREQNASALVLVASQVITQPLFTFSDLLWKWASTWWCFLTNPFSNSYPFDLLSKHTHFHSFQKTLPVMVAVIEPLRGAFGESGLLVLPCVAAHLNQVIYLFIYLFLQVSNISSSC